MIKVSQVAIFITTCAQLFALPPDIEKCRISDESCLIRSSNKVLRKYYAGITEINLESLDPFIVDKAKLKHDYGVVKVEGFAYNVKAFGFSGAKIERFFGFDKNLVEIQIKVPKLKFTGFYNGQGELLSFPLKSAGPLTMNFYDFFIKLKIKLERFKKNGKMYFRTVGSEISSTLRSGDLDVPDVGRVINWAINASFDIVLKSSLKAYVGDEWGKYYEQRINNVFNKVPIEDLFIV